MLRLHCLAGALFIAVAAINPAHAVDPIGLWLIADGTAKVRIFPCGEAICGTVAWLSEPLDAETGRPQTDKLNVEPHLRSRPMLGVSVILSMQRRSEDNKWIGRIYNPDDGKTYQASIEMLDGSRLKVEGCETVLSAMWCDAQIWTRSSN